MTRRLFQLPVHRASLAAAALVAAAGVPVVAAAPSPAAGAATCPWVGSTAPIDTRASQVLAGMTLDEKIAMVHGVEGVAAYTGYVPGNARLCIPALKMQDGPVGVHMRNTTQLPAASSLAASFDTSLARTYGSVIGAEDRTKGVDVDLGPTINIVRDPRWGRAFETYSEDPYLAGQIGAADVDGIQSQGVMAQVKHWAVYNQETYRNTPADNAIVDDRTVHEIYAQAFGMTVEQSQASSVMCSYAVVNGHYACENAYLNDILKRDFGFKGFITSDWGGTHSTVAAANAGMDMQMPDGSLFGARLKQAILDGHVPQSRLDDMVTRILREEFRFGLFDHPSPDTPNAVAATPAHLKVAEDVAEQGTVLLKNDGNLLPFHSSSVHSIAVIGAGAGPDTMSAGGGSAAVGGTGTITPYDGIKARAGATAAVTYAQGNIGRRGRLPAVDSTYLTPPSGTGHGLRGEYYTNTTLSGALAATRVDPQVSFAWNGASPAAGVPGTNFSVKWTGTLTPPVTGIYTFALSSDDGSRLSIDGTQMIDNWHDQPVTTKTGQASLVAGTPVRIEVDYYQGGGDAVVNLGWQPPGNDDLVHQAAALAARSDVAVVYANDFEAEGDDLSDIDLPADQNRLIDAVAAANPNTVVVLNTGSAVTMPWLDRVKGVFEAWYPGQQSGTAIAALLYGDVNPSAKLPVTFPASLDQVPASTPAQWPGVNGTVQYSEGLNVGYRWYDARNLTPRFPFGYGLSYTSFRFSNLRVEGSTLTTNGHIRVTADVTNTGPVAGAEVAQLYLSDPASTGEPPNQLKGFQKITLQPQQTTKVTFEVTARAASYWNTDAHAWTLGTGTYTVRIGNSSRSLPLSGTFKVDQTDGPRFTKLSAPPLAAAGSTLTVTTTFTNGATKPVVGAVTSLSVPDGWTVSARTPATFAVVRPGQAVSTTWSVTVPPGASPGAVALSADTRYMGSGRTPPGRGTATVQVAYTSQAQAYNSVGVSDDANPTAGNLDGAGFSFSAQALASVGVLPGGNVKSGSTSFVWPDAPAGQPDTVTTAGQTIALHGTGSVLSLLAVGTNGTQKGPLTVTYTDGTTSTSTVTVADWYANRAVPGCQLVVTTPYWNRPAGSTYPADQHVSLYAASVPLTAGKQPAYVTLPDNRELHIFAQTLS